jgi:hypothetical protein
MNKREQSTKDPATQGVSAADFRNRNSSYGGMGTKPHPKSSKESGEDVIANPEEVSLGHMLAHIFEKAINVHFMDFKAKLTNSMRESFFEPLDS